MDMNKDIVTLPNKGLKKYDYDIGMNKRDLKKLTKGQLIKLLLKKVSNHEDLLDNDPFKDEVTQEPTKRIKPTPPPRTGKWESVKLKPVPRKSVKEMVNEYEDIIQPPEQFRDAYKPRADRPLKIRNARRPPRPTRKPPPVPQVEEHIWAKPKPMKKRSLHWLMRWI